MSEKPDMKVVALPTANPLNLPEQLRALAKSIEDGQFGKKVQCLAWVLDAEDDGRTHVGLVGQADHPLLRAYMLYGRAQRVIERFV